MKRTFISLVFLLAVSSVNILSQDGHSIRFNGGIIMPMSSSKGLSSSVQFNYALSTAVQLYIYTGYSVWDQFKVIYRTELSDVQRKEYHFTYNADDHVFIPAYVGSQVNLHTASLFTSFITFELGYSYLSYNSYDLTKIFHPESGEFVQIYPDNLTKQHTIEHLFGLGIGAGISHPMTENVDLVFSFKLNTYINSDYYGIFSTRGTYTSFLTGFNFNI